MAQELDVELWSKLPMEVLEEHVLPCLPFTTLCTFRAVCKHWNTMPAVRPEEPYLLDIPCNSPYEDQLRKCYLYSSVTNIWSQGFDLSFVLASLSGLGYPPSWKPQIKAYCSDGGLLCLWSKVLEPLGPHRGFLSHYHILVCNPLTRSCKILPQIADWHECDKPMDLVMHKESSGGYKIFAATSDPHNSTCALRYFLYDSVFNSWKLILVIDQQQPKKEYVYCSIIFGGVFYLCFQERCYIARDGYALVTYDIKNSMKSSFVNRVQTHPKSIDVSFVVNNGHLLLIVEEDSRLSINKVELSSSTTALDVSPAYSVPRPKSFKWIWSAIFEYRNAIIFASDYGGKKRRRNPGSFVNQRNLRDCFSEIAQLICDYRGSSLMGVQLHSLSADLKDLKPIAPVSSRPELGFRGRYYRRNMKKINFDMKAII